MLMDRINCEFFLEKSYPDQLALVEKVRAIRSSALNAAKVTTGKATKGEIKKAASGRKKRVPKDQTKEAAAALAKLSPEQIAIIKATFSKAN